jgi:hypothetical protein
LDGTNAQYDGFGGFCLHYLVAGGAPPPREERASGPPLLDAAE